MGEPEVEGTVEKIKSLSNVSKYERTINKKIYLMEIIYVNNYLNECMPVMNFNTAKITFLGQDIFLCSMKTPSETLFSE